MVLAGRKELSTDGLDGGNVDSDTVDEDPKRAPSYHDISAKTCTAELRTTIDANTVRWH